MLLEIVLKRLGRSPVAGSSADVPSNDTAHMRLGGLLIRGVDPGIPQFWVGERHHLAPIARIRQYLLIPRHSGIENDFTEGRSRRPKGKSRIRSAIGEH